jgi:long-chain acyl-CoA synthetase
MIKEQLVTYFETSIKKNWEHKAFIDYGCKALTYGHVGAELYRLHALFEKFQIQEGDKIALMGRNSANWAIVYLATVSYGAVIVPILPDFTSQDTYHLVNHSESVMFFVADQIRDELDLDEMPGLKAVFALKDFSLIYEKEKNKKQFKKKKQNEIIGNNVAPQLTPESFSLKGIGNDRLAAIVYTSGTSGFSKGVMLQHNSLAANVRFAINTLKLESGDPLVSFLPLAHAYGCAFEFLYPFSIGCTVTFLTKIPAPQVILKVFNEVKPTLILTVPLIIEKIYKKKIMPVIKKPAIKAILKVPGLKKVLFNKIHAQLSSAFGGNYNQVVIGGAALNQDVENFLRKIGFVFTVGYGMTECGPLISYAYPRESRPYSCGKAIDCLTVKINSPDPEHVDGEILIKGENVMIGYYKNESATNEALDDDGWFHTGDLGTMDKDGFIYIKGRSKSMILGPSGQNIYPEEIEPKVNNLQYVQEAIVIEKGGRLIALVYPDKEYLDLHDIDEVSLKKMLEESRKEINTTLPKFAQISRMDIVDREFEKTPKKSIKRFLYTYPSKDVHRVD